MRRRGGAARRGGRTARLGVLLSGLGLMGRAQAQPEATGGEPAPPIPITLRYEVAAACPDAEQFLSDVRARGGAPAVQDAGDVLGVRVSITQDADGRFIGSLVFIEGSDVSVPRLVTSEQCATVVRALAFSAALSLEPRSGPRNVTASDASAQPLPTAIKPAEPPPARTDEPESSAARAVRLELAPYAASAAANSPPAEAKPSAPWHLAWRAHAAFGLPVDIAGAYGVGAALGLHSPDAGFWGPRLELGAVGATTALGGTDALAAFDLLTTEFGACANGVGTARVVFRPCALLQAGVLAAAGVNVSDPKTALNSWGAFGLGGELEYALAGPWTALLRVAGLLPLSPQEYYQGEDSAVRVASTLPLVPWVTLGLGQKLSQ